MTDKLKKYTYTSRSDGRTSGYYIGYVSLYSDVVSSTEAGAIRNAMKKLGGMDYIKEVRFHLDCKRFIKKNAFYNNVIGEIDGYGLDRPIYKSIVAGRVHRTYLLSKDGRKIKEL